MKSFIVKAGASALLGLCILTLGWSRGSAAPAQEQGKENQAQPGTPGEAPAPKVSKEELAAYNQFVEDSKTADARQIINMGETFVTTYPNSMYVGTVQGELAMNYMRVNDVNRMVAAGEKALAANPDNVDVLPLMAFAIPRRNGSTAQDLERAMNYARRAINLLSTMPKPPDIDDATFARVKNEKLAQCRSGMGTAYFKTGHFDEAVTELSQAVRLVDPNSPDPVDYYVLGLANERSSHFTDAVAAFDKCATIQSSLQANCKALSSETKKKGANSLEAPK
jgi:tetratricopeptide (TPR) repeat protein